MSSSPVNSTLNREQRQRCWAVRDDLFKCLDQVDLNSESDPATCAELRHLLIKACPKSWADYFLNKHRDDRRRVVELEKMGAINIQDAVKNGDVIIKTPT